MEATKEEFAAYQRVRWSMQVNMMTDSGRAAALSGLSDKTYWHVLKNYAACTQKWPNIVTGEEA